MLERSEGLTPGNGASHHPAWLSGKLLWNGDELAGRRVGHSAVPIPASEPSAPASAKRTSASGRSGGLALRLLDAGDDGVSFFQTVIHLGRSVITNAGFDPHRFRFGLSIVVAGPGFDFQFVNRA